MPHISRWIVGYGLLLVGCQAADSLGLIPIGFSRGTVISGWSGGALMVAAGLASAQGRRSLRLTGTYVGLFVPLTLAAICAWRAAGLWRGETAQRSSAVALSLLALASISLVWIISRLRPREGIASRGYAISLPPARKNISHHPHSADRSQRKSEAG